MNSSRTTSGEYTNQQATSLLGQMVEKLGHLVDQETGFFGNILPKLLDQPTERPLVLQNFEQQEIEEEPVSQGIQYRLKRLAKLRGKGIRIGEGYT